jgi:uncharacterized membrane protein (UPF0136 family)
MHIATYSLLVVALLIFVGGVIGFIKGKSKASIIAGTISSMLLLVCFFVCSYSEVYGYLAAFILLSALDFVFVKRLLKTKKFMPAGMILAICLVEQIILVAAFASASTGYPRD